MKITMYKHDMERLVHPDMIEQLKAAGWRTAKTVEKERVVQVEEQIVLKPPVKSKGTVKQTLDNANQQGEE
jgi:hypothetical protein